MLRFRGEIAQIDVPHLGPLCPRHLEVVGGEAVPEAAAAGVDLHEERARLLRALQLDEVVAAAERAELVRPALGMALAAPRDVPRVVDRNAVALGAAAIERRPVRRHVVLRAAAHEVLQLLLGQLAELHALAAGAHADALHHLAVEVELAIGRRALRRHVAPRAHHAAADVEPDGPHRHRALFAPREDDAADGDAVAVVHVRRDGDELHAGETRGVHDLPVERRLGLDEELLRQKEANGHVTDVVRLEREVAVVRPAGVALPVGLVDERRRHRRSITTLAGAATAGARFVRVPSAVRAGRSPPPDRSSRRPRRPGRTARA